MKSVSCCGKYRNQKCRYRSNHRCFVNNDLRADHVCDGVDPRPAPASGQFSPEAQLRPWDERAHSQSVVPRAPDRAARPRPRRPTRDDHSTRCPPDGRSGRPSRPQAARTATTKHHAGEQEKWVQPTSRRHQRSQLQRDAFARSATAAPGKRAAANTPRGEAVDTHHRRLRRPRPRGIPLS